MKTLLTGSYEELLGLEEEEDIDIEPNEEDERDSKFFPLIFVHFW